MNRINVLFLTPWFPDSLKDPRGGFILDSICAQEKRGVSSKIIRTLSWKPGYTTQVQHEFNIQTYRYVSIPRHYFRTLSNWSYILRFKRFLCQFVKDQNIHLIHAHTELCGLVATRVAKRMNIPAIVTVHGIDTCPRVWRGKCGKMMEEAIQQADRVVMVGKPLLNYFKPRLGSVDHVRIVHNGFRWYPDMLSFHQQAWSKDLKIISVSNLEEGKGVDITIHALAALKQLKINNWNYTIVGDGSQRRTLEQLVKALDLESHIHFAGLCSHDKVYALLKTADVFCLPSYREAFGIAYLEAMAYGLLAIGVQGEGPDAFIRHFETGLLVKPKDIYHLTEILLKVFQQADVMQAIARQGREYILQAFTWEKHAENIIQIYQEVLP